MFTVHFHCSLFPSSTWCLTYNGDVDPNKKGKSSDTSLLRVDSFIIFRSFHVSLSIKHFILNDDTQRPTHSHTYTDTRTRRSSDTPIIVFPIFIKCRWLMTAATHSVTRTHNTRSKWQLTGKCFNFNSDKAVSRLYQTVGLEKCKSMFRCFAYQSELRIASSRRLDRKTKQKAQRSSVVGLKQQTKIRERVESGK